MATTTNGSGALITGTNEYLKQHLTFDASSRLQFVYEARANAANGDICLVTKYQYDGVSSRVSDMKEYEGTWNSAWDF